MKAYEDSKFQEWRQKTEQTLPSLQKRNVLKELPLAESAFHSIDHLFDLSVSFE